MALRGWSNSLPAKPTKAVGDAAIERLRELMDAAYPECKISPA